MEETTKKTPAVVFAEKLSRFRLAQIMANELNQHKLDGKGRKQIFLAQGSIVYMVALWQSFIKYLAEESFNRLSPAERDERRRDFVMQLGLFNTPKPKNIDTLIEAATGIARITDHWHWEEMKVEQAKGRLSIILESKNNAVQIRTRSMKISLKRTTENIEFLIKLGNILNATIEKHFYDTKTRA